MPEDNFYISQLLGSYLKNNLSAGEKEQLGQWLDASPENRQLLERLEDSRNLHNDLSAISQVDTDAARVKAIKALFETKETPEVNTIPVHRVHFLRRGFLRYAAAIVVLLGAGAYWWTTYQKNTAAPDISAKLLPVPEARPGGNKALLTLADGSTITLDNVSEGLLAKQGNSEVVKLKDGQIAYNAKGAGDNRVMNNTISTPRGGQYQLVLPDGTRIWLNAASSITYPASFTGAERTVSITGEAYFEVMQDAKKPFKVMSGNMEVDVLGTSFNINTYEDETAHKTTLLDGSVRVKANSRQQVLAPGQQAEIPAGSGVVTDIRVIRNINTEQVVAWKSGRFDFNGVDLKGIMRQLARWYDIDVKYEGVVSADVYKGRLTRDLNLSQVLRILGRMEVKYRMEEVDGHKVLIVTQ